MHLQTHSITASKCISKLARSRPQSASLSSSWSRRPDASPIRFDHGLQVYLWVARSWPPNASPQPLDDGLQVHLRAQLDLGLRVQLWATQSLPPTASVESLDHCLQVLRLIHRDFRPPNVSPNSLNTASKCISQFNLISFGNRISRLTRLLLRRTSPSAHDHGFEVHLEVLSICVSWCSCGYALVQSAARLAICIYSGRLR